MDQKNAPAGVSASTDASPKKSPIATSSATPPPTKPPAAASVRTTPPNKPAKKPKRRWLLKLSLLLIIIIAPLYYAYQQPNLRPYMEPHWKNITKIATESVTKSQWYRDIMGEPEESEKPAESAKSPKTTAPTKRQQERTSDKSAVISKNTSPTVADSSSDNSSPDSAVSLLTTAEAPQPPNNDALLSKQLSQQLQQNQIIIADLQNNQIIIADLQNKVSSLNRALSNIAYADLKLSMIDLRLRYDGDTTAAAAALLSIKNNPDITAAAWVDEEISRLQNTTAKVVILGIINKLRRDAATTRAQKTAPIKAQLGDGVIADLGDSIISAFNIRKASDAIATDGDIESIARLELLFLNNQRQSYLDSLSALSQSHLANNPNIAAHIKLLKKFGAPVYALNYKL